MGELSFDITPAARVLLARYSEDLEGAPSIPEIIWVSKGEDGQGEWQIGFNPADSWETSPLEFRYTISGERFLISLLSPPRLALLRGQTLDVDESGRRLCFRKTTK